MQDWATLPLTMFLQVLCAIVSLDGTTLSYNMKSGLIPFHINAYLHSLNYSDPLLVTALSELVSTSAPRETFGH